MQPRKIGRLAGVLLASQLRSGKSFSDPRSFFGRPLAIAVADAVAFSLVFVLVVIGGEFVARLQPDALTAAVATVLPFVPLLGVAAVLVGGVMFELASTARFSASDAVNWLPVSAVDYVVASSLAIAGLYSLSIALLAGVALGLGLVTGTLPIAAFAVALGAVGLVEGALLIEVLRAVTQRAGTLGRRRGGAALAIRAAAFLFVLITFELLFNPVILYSVSHALGAAGPLGWLIPFLWSSDAVSAALAGNLVGSAVAVGATGALLAVTAFLAAAARVRYWVPTGGEVQFDDHVYAPAHSALRSFGLTRPEAAIVAKDLRGLVRRRELLPALLLPFVITVVFLVQGSASRSTPLSGFFTLGLLTWIGGISAMLLASSSFGQERRALVHLYAAPVRARSVLRAKAAGTLAVSLPTGLAITALGLVLVRPPISSIPGAILTVALVVVEGMAIGMMFGIQFADFQERPRPQFVRPLPMLGGTGLYMIVGSATAAVGLAASLGAPAFFTSVPIVAGVGAFLVVVFAGVAWALDRGVRRLFRQVPF